MPPRQIPRRPRKRSSISEIHKYSGLLIRSSQKKSLRFEKKAQAVHFKRRVEADVQTKRFRDNLEERERAVKRQKQEKESALELQKEVARLREEGLQKIAEEKEKTRRA